MVVLLYSCTLDDLEDKPITSNTSKKNAQLTNLTYEDLKNESAVINIVNQIQQYNNGAARGVFDETFQMTLDTNKIVKIESELRHSYTFEILEDSLDTNITRNLVLDYISQEYGYFAYIFEYNLTANEMESVQRGEFVDLQNHLSLYTYDTDFSNNEVNGLEFCTNVVYIAEQACTKGGHSYSMGNAGDCPLPEKDQPQPATFVIQVSICDNGGGGGTVSSPSMPGTWNPSSGGGGTGYGSVTTYPGNSTNPGSPNNNPNPDREPIDIFLDGIETMPILNLASIEGRFYNNLPASLQYFWDYDLSVHQKNQILDFLENNKEPGQLYPTQEAEAFAEEVLEIFAENADIDWSHIENWFLGENPGSDSSEIIDPENITYDAPLTQQNLPSMTDFVNNFPKEGSPGNYTEMSTPDVYELVGGSLWISHQNDVNNNYQNACAIRGSRGLLYSGIDIPVLHYDTQRTQKGGDQKNYILDAVSFDKFMRDKFGAPTYELTPPDCNDLEKVTDFLEGKNGIYVIVNSSHGQAGYSGHVDAIIDGKCISNAYATPNGGVKSIAIWELN